MSYLLRRMLTTLYVSELRTLLIPSYSSTMNVSDTIIRSGTDLISLLILFFVNVVHKSKIFLSVQCNAQNWTEYKIALMRLFSASKIIILDPYGTKDGCQKPVPQVSPVVGPVSGACHWYK